MNMTVLKRLCCWGYLKASWFKETALLDQGVFLPASSCWWRRRSCCPADSRTAKSKPACLCWRAVLSVHTFVVLFCVALLSVTGRDSDLSRVVSSFFRRSLMLPSTGEEPGLSPLHTGKAWLFLIAVKRYAALHSRCPTSAIFTVNGKMTTPENNTQYPTTSHKRNQWETMLTERISSSLSVILKKTG